MVDTDSRRTFSALAEETGWHHRATESSDYFDKGVVRVHVVWRGDDAMTGGTLYHDDLMQSYSRDPSTVRGWMKR